MLFLTSLSKADLILATQSKLCSNPITLNQLLIVFLFRYHLCQTRVKLWHSLPIRSLIETQRWKFTMVYLKDSFIVNSIFLLLIPKMALLQGLFAIRTGVGVENLYVKKCLLLGNLESWYLPLPRLNYLTFYLAVFFQIMMLV